MLGQTAKTTSVERLSDLLTPSEPVYPHDLERCAERLRWALEMSDFGLAMMRQNLSRRHPQETPEQIEDRLAEWLATRSDAPAGDGWGRDARHRFDF